MLAALRLLVHLYTFCQLPLQLEQVTLFTDSLSLIERLQKALTSPILIPRSTLASESDVLMQLQHALQELDRMGLATAKLHLQHVEGHQDTKYPDRDLTWDSTLNQRCDELASEQLKLSYSFPQVPFLPASRCSLQIGVKTITHHLPSQIRTAAGLPSLQNYLAKHHDWQEMEIFDTIDWSLVHSCTKKLSFTQRMFIVKWTNDILPFQAQQLRFHQSPSDSCPSSCGHPEDKAHFLRCPQQERTKKWSDFRVAMRATFELWKIDPYLRRVLLNLFPSGPYPSLAELPELYRLLLKKQQAVGPDSIFFGLLTTDWEPIQRQYMKNIGVLSRPNQAAQSLQFVIMHMLLHCHDLWLLRNEHLHGLTSSSMTSYKRLHLLAQITELYESSDSMLQTDRQIFSVPLQDRQTQTLATLRAFHRFAAPAVRASIKQAATLGRSFRPIDQYFLPRRIIPTTLRNTILGNSLAQNPTIDGQHSTQ